MPVSSIVELLPLGTVDDLMQYCTRFSASCNRASGRPRHLRVYSYFVTGCWIVKTIVDDLMLYCTRPKAEDYCSSVTHDIAKNR